MLNINEETNPPVEQIIAIIKSLSREDKQNLYWFTEGMKAKTKAKLNVS